MAEDLFADLGPVAPAGQAAAPAPATDHFSDMGAVEPMTSLIPRLAKEVGVRKETMPLVQAMLGKESSGGKAKTGMADRFGSYGPLQVTKATFDTMQKKGDLPAEYKWDDPQDNIRAGLTLIRNYADQYKDDPFKIASAYNGGPGTVKNGQVIEHTVPGMPNKSNLTYANDIVNRLKGIKTGATPTWNLDDLAAPAAEAPAEPPSVAALKQLQASGKVQVNDKGQLVSPPHPVQSPAMVNAEAGIMGLADIINGPKQLIANLVNVFANNAKPAPTLSGLIAKNPNVAPQQEIPSWLMAMPPAYLAAKLTSMVTPQWAKNKAADVATSVNQAVNQREKTLAADAEAQPGAYPALSRFAGQLPAAIATPGGVVKSAATAGQAAKLLLAQTAIKNGLGGLANSVMSENQTANPADSTAYLNDQGVKSAVGAGLGATVGAGLGATGEALTRLASSDKARAVSDAVKSAAREAGVTLTPGELSGNWLKTQLERFSPSIRDKNANALDAFQQATERNNWDSHSLRVQAGQDMAGAQKTALSAQQEAANQALKDAAAARAAGIAPTVDRTAAAVHADATKSAAEALGATTPKLDLSAKDAMNKETSAMFEKAVGGKQFDLSTNAVETASKLMDEYGADPVLKRMINGLYKRIDSGPLDGGRYTSIRGEWASDALTAGRSSAERKILHSFVDSLDEGVKRQLPNADKELLDAARTRFHAMKTFGDAFDNKTGMLEPSKLNSIIQNDSKMLSRVQPELKGKMLDISKNLDAGQQSAKAMEDALVAQNAKTTAAAAATQGIQNDAEKAALEKEVLHSQRFDKTLNEAQQRALYDKVKMLDAYTKKTNEAMNPVVKILATKLGLAAGGYGVGRVTGLNNDQAAMLGVASLGLRNAAVNNVFGNVVTGATKGIGKGLYGVGKIAPMLGSGLYEQNK